jgi:tRNA-2-methylthio-N6-dimethylallyladenosine synthase
MANNPKICKQIHLPLQSGNDRILDLMSRTYTQKEFLNLVEKIRKLIPGVALSTDVIVGFSSETDAEFEDTMKVMREVEFDSAFTFKYSERKNTIASRKFPDDVPDAIKTERIVRLNELQKAISLKLNQRLVGTTERALIEESKDEGLLAGRTDSNKLITFPNSGQTIGEFINLEITYASPHALKGKVLSS